MTKTSEALRDRLRRVLSSNDNRKARHTRRPEGAISVPATLEQEQFWCMGHLASDQAMVNVSRAWTIRGAFNPERLQAALTGLTHKYDSLRTALVETDGVLQLNIAERAPVDFIVRDLRETSDDLYALITSECETAFDLSAVPLVRARAYKQDEDDWVLLIVYHHALMDGWSLSALCREIGALYADLNSVVERPVYDFGDHAKALALKAAKEPLDQSLARWHSRDDPETTLALPFDYKAPASPNFDSHTVPVAISAARHSAIEDLAGRIKVAPVAIVLAAFRATLFHITGQREFRIGSTVLNRHTAELRSMIGALVKTVPLHQSLATEMTLLQLCQREHQSILQALAPSDDEMQTAQESPAISSPETLQAVLNYRGFITRGLQLKDCVVTPLSLPARPTPFPLVLNLEPSASGYCGEFVSNAAVFSVATTQRIEQTFQEVLDQLLTAPHTLLEDLGYTQKEAILRSPDPAGRALIPDLIERAFSEYSDKTAVVISDQRFSYQHLDRASAAWANALMDAPGAPGDLIALAMPRGFEFIAAMIGIWRSGRAFVPLAPGDPPDRLHRLLSQCAPAHFIGPSELAQTLGLSALKPSDKQDVTPLDVRADDLAYVMFTSGSTGTPKGVAVPQRAIANLLAGLREILSPQPEDRMLSVSSTTFDSIIYEFLMPLTTGGVLVMITESLRKDPWFIVEEMRFVPPDHFFATPSMWRMLVQVGLPVMPNLKALTGGEALSPQLAQDLLPLVGQLYNGYGPTEATVFSTYQQVRAEGLEIAQANVSGHPIGMPLPGYAVTIVDEDGCPVWPGRVGEICISGPGVALGYYKDPERTQLSFVEGRDAPAAGRWYKTGDLGRVLDNRAIGYAGRKDQQVKISGQRIEPGEVEHLILSSGLAAAASVLTADIEGTQTLVAVFVPKQEASTEQLRDYLRAHLPSAWVPGIVAEIEELPLTTTGKLDRTALLNLVLEAPEDAPLRYDLDVEIAPAVVDGWHQALGSAIRNVDQHFFDAGGNSLLLVRMLTHIRDRTKCHLPVADAFANATPLGLHKLLQGSSPLQLHEGLVLAKDGQGANPLIFTPGVEPAAPKIDEFLKTVPDDQSVYYLKSPIALPKTSETAFATMVGEYVDVLEHTFPETPLHVVGFSYGGSEAFETAREIASRAMPKPQLTIIDNGPNLSLFTNIPKGFDAYQSVREQMRRTHVFGVWDGDLTLIRGNNPTLIRLAMMTYGWDDHVTGQVSVHLLPAKHSEMMREYAADTVSACLGQTQAETVFKPSSGSAERRGVAELMSARNFDTALEKLTKVAQDDPFHSWSALLADDLATKLGLDGKPILERWIDTTDHNPPEGIPALAWHAGRAEALMRLGEMKTARFEVETARNGAPTLPVLEINYAKLLHQTNHAEKALTIIEQACERWGLTSHINLHMGICLAKLDEYERALPHLQQARHDHPGNMAVVRWLTKTEQGCGG